jgi:hypothetical protein
MKLIALKLLALECEQEKDALFANLGNFWHDARKMGIPNLGFLIICMSLTYPKNLKNIA